MSYNVRIPVIQPQWGCETTLPKDFKIDCSNEDMRNLTNRVMSTAREMFVDHGIVLLTKTGLKTFDEMSIWANKILGKKSTYDGGANSRSHIGKNVYDTGAPSSSTLHFHHEMAYLPYSVESLAFCCSKTPGHTGFTYVSDNVNATHDIMALDIGKKLRDKKLCYIRCLTDKTMFDEKNKGWNGVDEVGVYNHWQNSFNVSTKGELEHTLCQIGLEFEWGPENYCKTKYYADAFENFHGMNLLYSSVADDSIWFDSWSGISDMPTMDTFESATMIHRPLKLTYGDDSDLSRQDLIDFIKVYDQNAYPVNWEVGDILVICNFRWAHGRPSYHLDDGEERELGVILGPRFERKGQLGDI